MEFRERGPSRDIDDPVLQHAGDRVDRVESANQARAHRHSRADAAEWLIAEKLDDTLYSNLRRCPAERRSMQRRIGRAVHPAAHLVPRPADDAIEIGSQHAIAAQAKHRMVLDQTLMARVVDEHDEACLGVAAEGESWR